MILKRVKLSFAVVILALLPACTKQQPGDPPGTAAIKNFKQGLLIAKPSISAARIALPLVKQLDEEDRKAANAILDDVSHARDTFDSKLAPYDHFDSSNAQEVKKLATDAIDTLDELNRTGVTHIKNADARALASAAIEALRTAADMLLKAEPFAPA